MNKEEKWLRRRTGMITASELNKITSQSGKIIDGIVDYIRSKRWERTHGFSHPVSSWQMDVGNQQEPMVYEWAKANLGFNEIVYSKDLQEIPFWIAQDCPLGASPDAFVPSQRVVFEFKTLVSPKNIEFFGDDRTSYVEKLANVFKEHGDQIIGQFISNRNVEEIWLIKYIYQDDNIMLDTDSPLAPWRGLVFKFKREDLEESISEMKERIRLIDAMIQAPINASDFKKGEWMINDNGKLIGPCIA